MNKIYKNTKRRERKLIKKAYDKRKLFKLQQSEQPMDILNNIGYQYYL